MPSQFEAFGLTVMYPENWTETDSDASAEASDGVTLELPSGGFFALERPAPSLDDHEILTQFRQAIIDDYEEVEQVDVNIDDEQEGVTRIVDFQFYYLDLLIISRVLLLETQAGRLVVQIQGEDRDFEENQLVYQALLKQIIG